jgi:FtsP/CotA-like multicopper oxidase with cupredoxin domain
LIVLESGKRHDPRLDRTWLLSQGGPVGRQVLLNGTTDPELEFETSRRYRIRVININPSVPLILSLLSDSVPVMWRAVAKDGADLPLAQAQTRPATLRIGVGETYDFEFTPARPGSLVLRVVDARGRVALSPTVRVAAHAGDTQ